MLAPIQPGQTTPGCVAGPKPGGEGLAPDIDFGEHAWVHGRVFRNASLVRALLSFGAAYTAEWAFTVAISLVAFADGGAVAVGLVGMLRLLPSAFLAPVVAAYADRLPREKVLFASSAVRGLATLLCAPILLSRRADVGRLRPGHRVDDRVHALSRRPLRLDAAAVPGRPRS